MSIGTVEYRNRVADQMLERDLQQRIQDLAAAYKYWYYHTYDSRRSQRGFPDLVLLKPPRLIVAELKRQKEKLTLPQRDVLGMFAGVPHVEVYVWKPLDYLDGTIARVLRGETVVADQHVPLLDSVNA